MVYTGIAACSGIAISDWIACVTCFIMNSHILVTYLSHIRQ